MTVLLNDTRYLKEFISLNEAWITKYFCVEDADIKLAQNPGKVIDDGGYVFTLLIGDQVAGVCSLFKIEKDIFQLARMAVKSELQGNGYGNRLMEAVLGKLNEINASKVNLLSNTSLVAAINLYKKYGFETISSGKHPVYARVDIVMEKILKPSLIRN